MKARFPVLVARMQYPYEFQVALVIALCVAHNFIRSNGGEDDGFEQEAALVPPDSEMPARKENQEPESIPAKRNRDLIAEAMWVDYQKFISNSN